MDLFELSRFESIGYFAELILAELLFLHANEKKPHFLLRLFAGAAAFCVLLSGISLSPTAHPLVRFLLLFLIISASAALMMLCFFGEPFSILSSCIAGVATQHIANKLLTLLLVIPALQRGSSASLLQGKGLEALVVVVVYTAVWFFFARDYRMDHSSPQLSALSIAIVLICIGVNRLVIDGNYQMDVRSKVATSIYAILCCTFALLIQVYLSRWQQEQAESMVVKGLLAESEKQYEQWKTAAEWNAVKMHDLKHMLHRIETMADEDRKSIPDLTPIKEKIDAFAPPVQTGNEVIDVLLRNMDSACRQQNVRFNYVSYTEGLGSFDSMSLYFLFANAIDNARMAAAEVKDPEKRLVELELKQFGDSVIIHIWNYYEGEVAFEGDLPVSRKREDGHGFGVKSILSITKSLGGSMKAYTKGGIFHLNILLPMKMAEDTDSRKT